MTQHRLAHLTRDEVSDLVARDAVALLPIGSIEQHSHHLPLGTDTLLVDAVIDRALENRDGSPEVVRAATLPYGFSGHHQFAAAMSLSPSTLLRVLGDLLDSVTAMGFRRILVVNGHGGNQEMMSQAIKVHALAHPVLVGACSYWNLGGTDASSGGPGHAGHFETSLMLAAHPDLVGDVTASRPVGEPPLFDHSPVPGLAVERHGEWARVDGLTDSPDQATAEHGAGLLEERANGLAEVIVRFSALALPSAAESNSNQQPGGAPAASEQGRTQL